MKSPAQVAIPCALLLALLPPLIFLSPAESLRVTEAYCAVLDQDQARLAQIPLPDEEVSTEPDVTITLNTQRTFQLMEGIGVAFTEIGGEALSHLDSAAQSNILSALFQTKEGAGFSFGRLPVGANDFALSSYSLNDQAGDYAMEHFSLERDRRHLLPFVKNALRMNPSLRFQACPWSPPGWLKTGGKMAGGALMDEPEIYQAYAAYLRKFVEAYAAEGIRVDRLFVQNEPNREMDYPSCTMPPRQMIRLVVDYLRPEFDRHGLPTEIWAGPFQEQTSLYAHECLGDEGFRKAISGVGFQYSDPRMVQDCRLLAPRLPVMHTEADCRDGSNNALQARELYGELVRYLEAGCTAFTYWNLIVNERQRSAWDWRQNSMITIDRDNNTVSHHPDFAVMSLAGRMIRPGARRCEAFSNGATVPLAFMNLDGTFSLLLWTEKKPSRYRIRMGTRSQTVELPADALCGLQWRPDP